MVFSSKDSTHKKYVPVDEADNLILKSASYLAFMDNQDCSFKATTFDDVIANIGILTVSNKVKPR